jgi:putative hydrolase of the HAD superfamily
VNRRHLLIDADDTLWENNIYFERAFAEFCEFLGHSSLDPAQVRVVLDEIELANSRVHGYGSLNFGRNLRECYQRLAERHVCDDDLQTVTGFAERILESPMEVIDGVPVTLEYLAERHDLILFTKGHPDEQKLKLDRSGLGRWFVHAAIVKEKDATSYQNLLGERALDPADTWMIGNSPKSDINPALETGLNAVLVPHAHTWRLEHQEVGTPAPGRQFVTIERFADLSTIF